MTRDLIALLICLAGVAIATSVTSVGATDACDVRRRYDRSSTSSVMQEPSQVCLE